MTRLFTYLICVWSAFMVTGPAASADLAGTYGHDAKFLKQHSDAVVLKSPDSAASAVVVPEYQGRVMTSTTDGEKSFGWINFALIHLNKRQPHINVFGGEDRIWLGPEGGQFSVFFKEGDPFDLKHWQTPEGIDWGGWDVVGQREDAIQVRRSMTLKNYSGYTFDLTIDRIVSVLSRAASETALGVKLPADVELVGIESDNSLINRGKTAWTEGTGTLSIWILGMLNASASTTVVLPYAPGPVAKLGPYVNSDYFGDVPMDRLKIINGVAFFKGDAQFRSKIGVGPRRASDTIGSYDSESGVLTVCKYSRPKDETRYVNSQWKIQDEPFGGDVVNAYNDGPATPSGPQLGRFYELESSSSAAFLEPGEALTHVHRTFHFAGPRAKLTRVSRILLGVDLDEIEKAWAE